MPNLLHDPQWGQMRIAGFMSGSGTNLVKILEYEKKLEKERGRAPYHVDVIFSDNHESNAVKIGANFDVPVFVYDMNSYFAKRGKSLKKDNDAREAYEEECMNVLRQFECHVAAYAGYMRRATNVFVNSFLGINVHPADLTINNEKGERKYRGDHAVKDAMLAGEKEIRSTTHIVSDKVDMGQILMVSAPVKTNVFEYMSISEEEDNKRADFYQTLLKREGDWVIFPKTLEYIADGKFSMDNGKIYFEGNPIPNGIRLN